MIRSLRLSTSVFALFAICAWSQSPTPSTHVSAKTSTLNFVGRNYSKNETEFDPKTEVWSVFFDPLGTEPETGEQGLIFNFYGWNPPSSPASVAQAYIDHNQTIFKFQAPDGVTKAPAYFIVSENFVPEKSYGYVNIAKITSTGTGAYAVTYSRRFVGKSSEEVDKSIRTWLLTPEAKSCEDAIGKVGVDADWQSSLKKSP